jgi:nitrate reductase gamma subunit
MTPMDFLLLVRGPLFNLALAILVLGLIARLVEIFMLGRRANLAEPRGSATLSGFKTVYKRFLAPDAIIVRRAPFDYYVGIVWHLGFTLAMLFFIPHAELIRQTFGIVWPGLPNPLIDAITAITLLSLIVVLVRRWMDPIKRYISRPEDYLTWALTFLPVLTGYLAYHRLVNPYPLILGLHILSVELFMIALPFTKLTHIFTAFVARWYNGAHFGYKGVQS